jgi:hypothetical protein
MIDAINEIKREEKENKKQLQNMGNKKKSSANKELFTKKVKDEIKNFQNQISFKKYKNSFDTDKNDEDNTLLINQNSISISLLNWKQYEKNSDSNSNFDEKINKSNNWGPNIDSFMTIQTNGTLSDMVNVLNDNKLYAKDIQNIVSDKNKFQQINNNNNKDYKQMKNAGKTNTNDKKIKTNSKTTINNKKKINDKNYTYKYAKTSNNATNSSSILSKRTKNKQTSSSACKNQKKNKENENKNIKEKKSNVYQNKSPKIDKFKIKKNFCKTNTNFNKVKASLNKNKKKNNINTEDNLLLKQNENISKKYIKCKHISQDFDSNTISKVTNNILNNNTNMNTNSNNNIKNINFFTDNNPNLITGNTILNTKNNNLEKKVHVNVRDIIKNNKEREKEKEKDIIFNTAEKIKNDSKAKLVTKMTRMRTNNYMTSSSLKINNENSINKKRNFSLVNKEKTGNKIENKKLLTKQQKSKTKGIFIKIKNLDKKRNLKEVKETTKEKNKKKPKEVKEIQNKNNEKNNTIIIEVNKDDNNLNLSEKKQEVDNNITSEKKVDSENKVKNKTIEQKDEIKNEPNEAIYKYNINKKKIMSEREMSSNLSDSNMIKILNQKTFTPHKFQQKFQNNHLFNTLNSSIKFASNGFKRKFKTFLVKKKKRRKIKTDQNHNSQKNLLSINILNRIKEAKKNRTKNNFYKTGLLQSSSEINTNTINLTKSTQFKNNTINLTKTPLKKTSKLAFFKKNNTSQKFNIYKSTNKKEDSTKNYMSSFTIKVNKNILNKDKNKNLKKTLSKNTNNVVRKVNNNIKKEYKK